MTYVRNNLNQVICAFNPCGKQIWMQNAQGQTLGRYDGDYDYTYNAHGQIIGKGNQLMLLAPRV